VIPEAAFHRDVCGRCRRPTSVCYCAHLVSLPTRTRVILLQHPRERHVPIGTARLAHLCLPDSELHVGVNFDDDRQVRTALADDADRPAYLLFPGPRAIDLAEAQLAGPITLVVVDGTWWQARKLLKRNAVLAALPQIRFSPRTPSNYRIRREPADHCVATVEALAQVLGALEGAPERFATLLRPFEAMIDTQIHYATNVRGARQRHALHRARKARRPATPSLLRERAADVVCLHGEANAWPARRPGGHPAEIVHWVARRARTGETFEAIIAPRQPLAPAIPRHIRIPTERLAAGESWESFRARWTAFARPDDLICAWGRYPLDLLEGEGVALSPARLDMRPAAGVYLGARAGSVEECTARMGVETPDPFAIGRGGARLAALSAIVDKMMGA
jgi:DTW domain-containing protein